MHLFGVFTYLLTFLRAAWVNLAVLLLEAELRRTLAPSLLGRALLLEAEVAVVLWLV